MSFLGKLTLCTSIIQSDYIYIGECSAFLTSGLSPPCRDLGAIFSVCKLEIPYNIMVCTVHCPLTQQGGLTLLPIVVFLAGKHENINAK